MDGHKAEEAVDFGQDEGWRAWLDGCEGPPGRPNEHDEGNVPERGRRHEENDRRELAKKPGRQIQEDRMRKGRALIEARANTH